MIKDPYKTPFLLLGALIICLVFIYIEYTSPYNFTKDDNFAQFLPTTLEGLKQIFNGDFPYLNLHQYLGTQIFETGTYAVFYPVTIISYFLAHYVFSNDFWTFEIFVLIHLILGFIAVFLFLSTKIKRKTISLWGALAFIFSGYLLIATSNWYYVIPSAVFLPLMLYYSEKNSENNIRNTIFWGILRGIYFYSGNAQYFAFACMFELLYLILIVYQKEGKIRIKDFEKYFISIIITLIIACPLLFSQLGVVQESPRAGSNTIGYLFSLPTYPQELLIGSLFTYPLAKSTNYFAYSSSSFSEIYFSGAIFSIIFIFAGSYFIWKYGKKSLKKISPLFFLALLSILLSFGIFGLIYCFGAIIPIIKSFSSPFKITLFTNFFVVCFGAIAMDLFATKMEENKKDYKKILAVLAIFFGLIIIYHINVCTKTSWTYYGDSPPLNLSKYEGLNLNGRIISVFTNSSFDPRLVKYSTYDKRSNEEMFLSQSFSTYYGIDNIAGYEPFIDKLTFEKIQLSRMGLSDRTLNLTSLREYGVQYVFIPNESLKFHPEISELKQRYNDGELVIIEIKDARGLVFSENGMVNYTLEGSRIKIEINGTKSQNITVNLLYKKNYFVKLNGVSTKIEQDSLGRMYFAVPDGKNEIEFYYVSKQMVIGLFASLFLLIVLLGYLCFEEKIKEFLISLREKNAKKKNSERKIRYGLWILGIILVISILFFVFIKFQVMSASNVQGLIKERTNIDIRIESTKVSFIKENIKLNQVRIMNKQGRESSYAENITLKISTIKTIRESLRSRKLVVVFDSIDIENYFIVFNSENKKVEDCKFPLKLNLPEGSFNATGDKIQVNDLKFIPLNKAYLQFNTNSTLMRGNNWKKAEISANLSVEKYLFGDIGIETEDKGVSKKSCVILPLDSYSILYY